MDGFNPRDGVPGFTVRGTLPFPIPMTTMIQQSLAMMLGYTYGEGVVLRASPSGILYVAEPRISDVFHWTAGGAGATFKGDKKACTQIMCIGHPDNADLVWIAPRKTASATNGIPIAKNQSVTLSVENLDELNALIVANGEKLIVAYSL